MPAHVQEAGDLAIGLPGHDDRILAHVRAEEIVRLRDLRLVAKEKPAAGKDLLQLALVDFRIRIDAPVDPAAPYVYQLTEVVIQVAAVHVPSSSSASSARESVPLVRRIQRASARSCSYFPSRSLNFRALASAFCSRRIALWVGADRPSSQSCSDASDTPSQVANFDWLSPVASRMRLICSLVMGKAALKFTHRAGKPRATSTPRTLMPAA